MTQINDGNYNGIHRRDLLSAKSRSLGPPPSSSLRFASFPWTLLSSRDEYSAGPLRKMYINRIYTKLLYQALSKRRFRTLWNENVHHLPLGIYKICDTMFLKRLHIIALMLFKHPILSFRKLFKSIGHLPVFWSLHLLFCPTGNHWNQDVGESR